MQSVGIYVLSIPVPVPFMLQKLQFMHAVNGPKLLLLKPSVFLTNSHRTISLASLLTTSHSMVCVQMRTCMKWEYKPENTDCCVVCQSRVSCDSYSLFTAYLFLLYGFALVLLLCSTFSRLVKHNSTLVYSSTIPLITCHH